MSTHCFMKTEKHLVAKEVELDLKSIIRDKFNDLLKLECRIKDNEICNWDIRFDSVHCFPVCLKTNKNLIFEHPDNSWALWAQNIVEHELAKKYDAKMLDEEYPQQKSSPLEYFSTFVKYLDATLHHSEKWKQAIIAIEFSHLPAELKKF